MTEYKLVWLEQPAEKVKQDTERDNFMSAEEAKTYGIIDQVIEHR